MQKNWEYYDAILHEAEEGNPHAMLQLSKLYRLGVFQDDTGERSIYFLKQFFSNPAVDALVRILEAEEDSDFDAEFYKSMEIVSSIGFEAKAVLQMDIIEAGISLGLYFKNSTDKDELFCARDSLGKAYTASRFDHLEIPGMQDVVSILLEINNRIEQFGYKEDVIS